MNIQIGQALSTPAAAARSSPIIISLSTLLSQLNYLSGLILELSIYWELNSAELNQAQHDFTELKSAYLNITEIKLTLPNQTQPNPIQPTQLNLIKWK